jgi:hypothetical protein
LVSELHLSVFGRCRPDAEGLDFPNSWQIGGREP